MTMHIDTVVIGAGAAGLHVARRLQERGIPFLLLDDHERIGDSWRERYRSLRLFTPRRIAELPGLHLGIRWYEFPAGGQLADYLERYAAHFGMPVRLATRVTALTRDDAGLFRLAVSRGDEITARRVVVAAGAERIPIAPAFADRLDAGIRRFHSTAYTGPEQFADGPVLVVGAANSGTDIALEAAAAGHDVTIAGRHPGQVPGDIDTPIGNLISRIFIRRLQRTTIDTPEGRALRDRARGHGVNLVRNTLRDLRRAGVARTARITGVDAAGRPVTADGTSLDAATVVWCTGARPGLDWIAIDGARGPDGLPDEYRGMSRTVPGLAFIGLPFQYSVVSPTLMGMGVDADHVVTELTRPAGTDAGRASGIPTRAAGGPQPAPAAP